MPAYKYLFRTIQGESPNAIAADVQHYSKLGYFIQGGQIHSHNKLKSLLPFRVITEYTVFMQKTIKADDEEG